MTEQEWFAAPEPDDLLEFLHNRGTDRQFRLFICACCRRFLPLMPKEPEYDLRLCEEYISQGEKLADGLITWEKLRATNSEMDLVNVSHDGYVAAYAAINAITPDLAGSTRPMLRGRNLIAHPAWSGAQCSRTVIGWLLANSKSSKGSTPRSKRRMATIAEKRYQIEILHDIFGNPFQPVTFDSGWHSSTVCALARQMYATRDFSALPILADALQDAGCEDGEVLSHCRNTGPHVRGFWVVDRLIARE